jgi:hypothetical protein
VARCHDETDPTQAVYEVAYQAYQDGSYVDVVDAVRSLILAEAAADLRSIRISQPQRPILRSPIRSDVEHEQDYQQRVAYADGMVAGIALAAGRLASVDRWEATG